MHRLYPKNGGKFPKLVYSGYPAMQESSKELVSLTGKWIRYSSTRRYGVPSICMRTDGKLLASYWDTKNNKIYLSIIDNPMWIFTVDNCGNNPTEYEFTNFVADVNSKKQDPGIFSTANMRCSLVRNGLGELLLICSDPGSKNTKQKLCVYKSISGNGNSDSDWVLLSNAYESAVLNVSFDYCAWSNCEINNCYLLDTGRLILPFGRLIKGSFNVGTWIYSMLISDDNGVSWNYSDIVPGQMPNIMSVGDGISGIARFGDTLFTVYGYYTTGTNLHQRFAFSNDFGDTWNLCDVITGLPGESAQIAIRIYEGDFWNLMYVTRPNSNNWYIMFSEKTIELDVIGQTPYRGSNWKVLSSANSLGWEARYVQSIDVPDAGVIIVVLQQSNNKAGSLYGWYWR